MDRLEPRCLLASIGIVGGVASFPRAAPASIIFVEPLPDDGFLLGLVDRPDNFASGISLLRVRADGTLDTSFGDQGTAVVSSDPRYSVRTTLDAGSGRLAIYDADPSETSSEIIMFRSDGRLDTGFSADGRLTLQKGGAPLTLQTAAFAPDGKLLVAARLSEVTGENQKTFTQYLIRLNENGAFDNSFGVGGFATIATGGSEFTPEQFGFPATSSSNDNIATAIRFDTDGSAVVLSRRVSTFYDGYDNGFEEVTLLHRVTPSGAPDQSFAAEGMVDFGPELAIGEAIDLRIVPRGYEVYTLEKSSVGSIHTVGVIQLNIVDRSGGLHGHTDSYRQNFAQDVLPAPDGGFYFVLGTTTEARMIRVQPDLTIDRSFGVGGSAFVKDQRDRIDRTIAISATGTPVVLAVPRETYTGDPSPFVESVRFDGVVRIANSTPGTIRRAGDAIEVLGTPDDDTISVSSADGRIQIVLNDSPAELFDDSGFTLVIISAGAGDDRVEGGDVALGGDGNDRISGAARAFGGRGRDSLFGSGMLDGGPDRDLLRATGSAALLIGGRGNDQLFGSEFEDELEGGGGDDYLFGGGGFDVLRGQTGRDTLTGGLGRDTLLGGRGERDLLNGGPDIDTADPDPLDVRRLVEILL